MDGPGLAISCKDSPGCNPCGICNLSSTISQFIQQAINTPIEMQSDGDYEDFEFTSEMAQAMDSLADP
jgi:hypothetical protein